MKSNKSVVAPYGTWTSPITAELLTSQTVDITAVDVHNSSGKIYYQELRYCENGRSTIIEHSATNTREVLPRQYSASSGIHEYGGGDFCVGPDSKIIFTDGKARSAFLIDPYTGDVEPIINSDHSIRWGDFHFHPTVPRWILAIKEDHNPKIVENLVAVIDSDSKRSYSLARGADFYKHPRFSHDGRKICWIQWNHPDMPWTGTELYVAKFEDGKIGETRLIAGTPRTEAIDEPVWGPDGSLFFVSDRTGYLQLYQLRVGAADACHIKLDGLESVEFSGRNPALGSRTYIAMNETFLVASYTHNATNRVVLIDLAKRSWKDLGLPFTSVRNNALQRLSDTQFVIIGVTTTAPKAIYQCDITQGSVPKLIKSSLKVPLLETLYSKPTPMSFSRTYGKDKAGVCYCLFSAPNNPGTVGSPGSLPPLIVSLHGGPTSHTSLGIDLTTQFWTTRGFAWVDINYTGSSGYGRAYRDALNGLWGVADTDDSASCISHLISAGLIDGTRVGICGASAGGFGVLRALCTYPTLWAGGVSEFGVSDISALVAETHKFERHYLSKLLFMNGEDGLSNDEISKVYRERSPLFHADRITVPVLLLQGDEDRVVPANQAFEMEKLIKRNGGEVKVVIFEGEGHGFMKEYSIKHAIEEKETWWLRTLVRQL